MQHENQGASPKEKGHHKPRDGYAPKKNPSTTKTHYLPTLTNGIKLQTSTVNIAVLGLWADKAAIS